MDIALAAGIVGIFLILLLAVRRSTLKQRRAEEFRREEWDTPEFHMAVGRDFGQTICEESRESADEWGPRLGVPPEELTPRFAEVMTAIALMAARRGLVQRPDVAQAFLSGLSNGLEAGGRPGEATLEAASWFIGEAEGVLATPASPTVTGKALGELTVRTLLAGTPKDDASRDIALGMTMWGRLTSQAKMLSGLRP